MPVQLLQESWASVVQWWVTRMIYPWYAPDYFGNYTGVVEDLVDGIGVGPCSYDWVEGYTMDQIEKALKGAMTWTQWKDNIKNKYNNKTENNLDNLFAYWGD